MSGNLIHITSEHDNHYLVEGKITQLNVIDLVQRLTANPMPPGTQLTLDLSHSRIEDGLALLTVLNTLKAIASRIARIELVKPPEQLERAVFDLHSGSQGRNIKVVLKPSIIQEVEKSAERLTEPA